MISLLFIMLFALFVLTPKQLLNTAKHLGQLMLQLKKLKQQLSGQLQEALNHLELQNNIARAEQAEKTNTQLKL